MMWLRRYRRRSILLHRAKREEDDQGRILATLHDYRIVRDLLKDVISEQVQRSVSKGMRETVASVAEIIAAKKSLTGTSDMPVWAGQTEIVANLELDKSTVSRRIAAAIEDGYLDNIAKRGRSKIVLAAPLPLDLGLLPEPERLLNGEDDPR